MDAAPDGDRGAGPGRPSHTGNRELSEGRIILLAMAAAIVTANAYYIHHIIAK